MKSEWEIQNQLAQQDLDARFSFLRFLIYGWFGWVIMLLLSLLFSPLFFVKYMIQTFSIRTAKRHTRTKISIWVKKGLGYYIPDTRQEE